MLEIIDHENRETNRYCVSLVPLQAKWAAFNFGDVLTTDDAPVKMWMVCEIKSKEWVPGRSLDIHGRLLRRRDTIAALELLDSVRDEGMSLCYTSRC